ncbi:MAG: B12-binding domain-containing radical SAM protein [Niameybacter sp.]|uniref:B12-binding domain-containing radical SAM protein n=1 Tax=Niameybacter sp. TaxID=2033640 RepID=UPI002FCC01A9
MKILLVSFNAKFIHSSLALRLIRDYCTDYKEHMEILELTINHQLGAILKEIYTKKPDILGLSCYIWNMDLVEELVPLIKKVLPDTKIVLGGPEVSYNSEPVFDKIPVDMIMENEGEETWYDYCAYLIDGKGSLETLKGIVYRTEAGKVRRNMARPLMDMAKLPFVYDDLTGLEHRIMYYEASRGCPFNCQYCLSSIEKGVRFMPLERVLSEIQYFLDQGVKQVKFVDRTFNTSKHYARAIWHYIIEHDNGYTNFHFEIAAELLEDACLEMLKDARPGLIQFEIGVQSSNIKVLTAIDRKMPFEDIQEISLKIKALGNIHQHLDLIAGLPFEDYASFRQSFNDVISLRPEQFQLGFLKLLKGSGLRTRAEEYGIVYHSKAPYEVLYTNHISFAELLKLHGIEELVERYYNSERFNRSLEYLYTLLASPFDFYEAFNAFWESNGYDKVAHKKDAYYLLLVAFADTLEGISKTLIRELVKMDWYAHEMVKDLPTSLITLNQSAYREDANSLVRDDAFMIEKVGVDSTWTSRQRLRKMHIEWFTYHVEGDLSEAQTPLAYLFDYTLQPTRYTLLNPWLGN